MKSENMSVNLTKSETTYPRESSRAWSLPIKRAIDFIGSLIGLVVLSPVFLIIVVLIRRESSGPAIFKQTRLGRNGKPFTFYKFRSMLEDSGSSVHENYIYELIHGQDVKATLANGGEKAFKLTDDNRITRFGRFLRRTSLDELPQLINVLKGEMSLVGPRPAIPYEVKMYKDWYKRRLTVVPGITGLWQVSGRSELSFEDMVRLDIDYVDNWSLWSDIKILSKTIWVVLRRRGAW